MALIELDLTDQPGPAPSSPPPAHLYRLPGLILAAVLVLAAGAAAPAGPTLWRYLGSLPVTPGLEEPFELTGGRAYTMNEIGPGRQVTAWSLAEPPQQLWQTRYDLPARDQDAIGFGGFHVERAGDVVLISHGPSATVLDGHSGQVRWSTGTPVAAMAGGRIGLIQEPRFRPGTVYDQESGAPGQLWFTAGGEPHDEPPSRTDLRGVDLYTGATVWSRSVPGAVIAETAPGDAPAVLLLSSTGMERLDGVTGRPVHRTAPPKVDGRSPLSGEIIGDLMMIYYYDTEGYATHEAAYAPGDLAPLWVRDVPPAPVQRAACTGLVCSDEEAGLAVLDPATGRPMWRAPTGVDLIRRGGYLLEQETSTGTLVRLVDPPTGTSRVDLDRWPAEVVGGSDESIVLRRGLEKGVSAFGVIDAGHDRVQPLGTTAMAISDCQADSRYVVCRAQDSLRVWAYRG
ncbi:hypothetical protein AB0J83_17305 [Actinoplanes sp. NPDC049596]|uniref:outer membrane protein assembly factor BamB family protein n=1 Tax=unclassified Actinoplanes TaxID=2626549 RepID=UPI00341E43AA